MTMSAIRIDVSVGERELNWGRPDDERRCPVAAAIANAGCTNVSVGGGYAAFRFAGRPVRLRLPHRANRFVDAFDAGERGISGFAFSLDIPDAEDAGRA